MEFLANRRRRNAAKRISAELENLMLTAQQAGLLEVETLLAMALAQAEFHARGGESGTPVQRQSG
jgi:hypothetical protein